MPDHVHALLTPAPDMAIERCAQLIKGGFSFAIRKDVSGEVWQEGYHAHRVTDNDDLHNQTQYILNNPVRKHLEAYPHIHTAPAYATQIDPPPNSNPYEERLLLFLLLPKSACSCFCSCF
jgi:putative transposase